MKFITLTKPVTVPAADLFSKPTILPAGKRFKITDRDGINLKDGIIFKRWVNIGDHWVTVIIPTDAVTEKTLDNFKVN